ncbi:response regulator transcription factor [Mucilaginibacter endophyticus]|uniref:response regulator transcription factor n=1 Tax=Mucilaginibacter endophyticus TaxID=2675003 RepID=UPI000E0DAE77|nr:response regulator transcription factor [Mucilaginibacter endophyticus]
MSIRITIFDDNPNMRNSIRMLLSTDFSFEIVGAFGSAMNCLEDIKLTKPSVVLMDLEMPGISGIDAIRLIKKHHPEILILVQTVFEDDDRIYDSIIAGASGYVLKNTLKDNLITAVKELDSGGSPMSPSIARKVLALMQQPLNVNKCRTTDYGLTQREKEVLACVVNGLSHKMIAAELKISYETVRSHMKNIYEKLHVASLTEVVAKAINHNII